MDYTIFLVIGGLVAIAIVGAIYSAKAQRERQLALQALAARLGYRFSPRHDTSISHRYQHFDLFTCGHSRVATNTMTGRLEVGSQRLDVQLGDYSYKETSGSGRNRRTTTYYFAYVIARLPWRFVETLDLRREGVFDKIGSALGFDDIDFESAEFSRKYHVKGSDKNFVYDVLDPRMLQWMLDTEPPAFSIRSADLLLHDRGNTKPESVEVRLEWIKQFVSRWPRHVVDRLQAAGPTQQPD